MFFSNTGSPKIKLEKGPLNGLLLLFYDMETVQVTLLRRTQVSFSQFECANCSQQGHAGSKTCSNKILQFLTGGGRGAS